MSRFTVTDEDDNLKTEVEKHNEDGRPSVEIRKEADNQ